MLTELDKELNKYIGELSEMDIKSDEFGLVHWIDTGWGSEMSEHINDLNIMLRIGKLIWKEDNCQFRLSDFESVFVKSIDSIRDSISCSRIADPERQKSLLVSSPEENDNCEYVLNADGSIYRVHTK